MTLTRMIVRSRGLAAIVFGAFVLAGSASGAPQETITDLTVGKTQERIHAFGTVEPPRPNGSVSVRLARADGGDFERIARKVVPLSNAQDVDGDGDVESRYRVSFARPEEGTCRIRVVYAGNNRSARSKDEHQFPCGIPDFGSGTARITSDTGTVEVDLLLAETGEQQGYGLMYRMHLAPDRGMAFLWSSDVSSSFYMRNTLIPLSIAFFNGTNRIVSIQDMEPCDDDEPNCPLYSPGQSYRGALEVNQGSFAEWGVSEGDTIVITE